MNPWIQLVRAPAALTVLGDTVAGAAAAGNPLRGRRLVLPLSSATLYWSGMALNDWADRELDAVERPERPIPSGRVSPSEALAVAAGLTATGIGLAAFGGGRHAVRVAALLAASIWAYDAVLKSTPAGPAAMAACRGLDVLLGAGASGAGRAWRPAAAIAGHTLGVTALSRGEVHGGSRTVSGLAVAGTAVAALASVSAPARSGWHRLGAALLGGAYSVTVGSAQLAAAREPSAAQVRRATVAGIQGMIPLQAAVTARRGSLVQAGLVACALPIARRLSRKVSPT